jgi:hypothetical protein
MHDNQPGTWLARDGDDRIFEVDADDYPGAEAQPGDGRPIAEAADSDRPEQDCAPTLDVRREAGEAERAALFRYQRPPPRLVSRVNPQAAERWAQQQHEAGESGSLARERETEAG